MTRNFTGRHMATILVVGFGIVVAVNFTMARFALSTFGGIVVENSYVASQNYNGWLDKAQAQEALGWQAGVSRSADNRVIVDTGNVPEGAQIIGMARHPLGREADQNLTFTPTSDHQQISIETLKPGRWTVRLRITSAGEVWRGESALR